MKATLIVGAALLALVGWQQMRVMDRDTTIEQKNTVIALQDGTIKEVNRVAAEAKAAWLTEKGALERQHATAQQEANDGFKERIAVVEQGRAADRTELVRLRGDNERLRGQVRGYAAITRTEGESDTALAGRAAYRLSVVGLLLEEGVGLATREAELAAEGRRLVEQRDAEVDLLKRQIATDRAACSAPPAASAL